jgi:hypothetical protein
LKFLIDTLPPIQQGRKGGRWITLNSHMWTRPVAVAASSASFVDKERLALIHRDAGEVGAGITRAPLGCFIKIVTTLALIPLGG